VISSDYVLNIEKSPYLVNDALVVKSDVKLTIHAGTVIWFRSLGIIVKGELQILGTKEDPVRLSSLGRTSWKTGGVMKIPLKKRSLALSSSNRL